MSVMIGQASIDERGKISGGLAGNQSGAELNVRAWYAGGWTLMLRPKSEAVARKMANACAAAIANPRIGYDQSQRNTLREFAKVAGWDLKRIEENCETDCSAFMAVCAEAAGVDMRKTYTAGNAPATFQMREKWGATGAKAGGEREMVEKSKIIVDGKEVPVERILKDGTNYVKIRDLAAALGLEVSSKGNIAVLSHK